MGLLRTSLFVFFNLTVQLVSANELWRYQPSELAACLYPIIKNPSTTYDSFRNILDSKKEHILDWAETYHPMIQGQGLSSISHRLGVLSFYGGQTVNVDRENTLESSLNEVKSKLLNRYAEFRRYEVNQNITGNHYAGWTGTKLLDEIENFDIVSDYLLPYEVGNNIELSEQSAGLRSNVISNFLSANGIFEDLLRSRPRLKSKMNPRQMLQFARNSLNQDGVASLSALSYLFRFESLSSPDSHRYPRSRYSWAAAQTESVLISDEDPVGVNYHFWGYVMISLLGSSTQADMASFYEERLNQGDRIDRAADRLGIETGKLIRHGPPFNSDCEIKGLED